MNLWAMHAKEMQQAALDTKAKVLATDFMSGDYKVQAGSLKELMKKCGECEGSMLKVEEAYKAASAAHGVADGIVTTEVVPKAAAVAAAAEAAETASEEESAAMLAFTTSKNKMIKQIERGVTIIEAYEPKTPKDEFLAAMDKLGKDIDFEKLAEAAVNATKATKAHTEAKAVLKEAKASLDAANAKYAEALTKARALETTAKDLDIVAKKTCGMMKAMEAALAQE